jgi:hypothetical protein
METRKVGTRVCSMVPIQVNKRVFVPEGELGTVVDHYQEGMFGNGIVVKWDRPQDGLQYWENTSLLVGDEVSFVAPFFEALRRQLKLVSVTEMSIAAGLLVTGWGNLVDDLMNFIKEVC